ncbi:MAG: glycosyltransferase family 9 protein [Verrucomicrobiales bacterium]|nr:glycosyltransferase family 9 protein [Verrucomicrobiales bacterium]
MSLTRLTPQRLIVRGVNWLGDAVMSTPALLRLRERFPHAQIALLTPSKLADLWRQHPAVDVVLPFVRGESPWRIGRRLRQHNFEVGLLFPNSPRSALELWCARIPVRIGYRRPWRTWWLTHPVAPRADEVKMHKRAKAEITRLLAAPAVDDQPGGAGIAPASSDPPPIAASLLSAAHHLHLYLELVHALGARRDPLPPLLRLSAAEQAAAPDLLERFGVTRDATVATRWFGLNPGAEYGPAKRWPAERFIAVAKEVQARIGCRWLVFGGALDRPLAETIVQAVPGAVNLAGRTSLRELLQLLGVCRLLLTNDTGPAHVAAALGVSVVALFGSTSPELTAPGLPGDPRHRILRAPPPCAPCFRRECPVDLRCLRALEPAGVARTVLEMQAAVR